MHRIAIIIFAVLSITLMSQKLGSGKAMAIFSFYQEDLLKGGSDWFVNFSFPGGKLNESDRNW